jgi:hypothetical protein
VRHAIRALNYFGMIGGPAYEASQMREYVGGNRGDMSLNSAVWGLLSSIKRTPIKATDLAPLLRERLCKANGKP